MKSEKLEVYNVYVRNKAYMPRVWAYMPRGSLNATESSFLQFQKDGSYMTHVITGLV
jgi:hypothetical protein